MGESASELHLQRLVVGGEALKKLCHGGGLSEGYVQRIEGCTFSVYAGYVDVLRDINPRAVVGDVGRSAESYRAGAPVGWPHSKRRHRRS